MALWTCTQCNTRRRGPAAPLRDATVRFCLTCSTGAKRLVRRRNLTAEKQAVAREEKRQEQRRQARFQALEAEGTYYALCGLNLFDVMTRFWNLPAIQEARRVARGPEPDTALTLTVRRSKKFGVTGFARHRSIHITIGSDEDIVDVVSTLLHEVVHAALPMREVHSDRFWAYFREACAQVWPDIWHFTSEGGFTRCRTRYQKHDYILSAVRVAVAEQAARLRLNTPTKAIMTSWAQAVVSNVMSPA